MMYQDNVCAAGDLGSAAREIEQQPDLNWSESSSETLLGEHRAVQVIERTRAAQSAGGHVPELVLAGADGSSGGNAPAPSRAPEAPSDKQDEDGDFTAVVDKIEQLIAKALSDDDEAVEEIERQPHCQPAQGGEFTTDSTSTCLEAQDIRALFKKNFKRLDKDADGFVSKSEINDAMKDASFTGQDAQLVAVLKEHREDLEELSNDETGDENDGVTLADMDKFHELQAERKHELKTARNIKDYGLDNFDKMDADGNGFLTRKELDEALDDKSLTGSDREAVEAMAQRLEEIEEASNDEWGDENDGITRDDLKQYYKDIKGTDESKLVGKVQLTLSDAGKSLSHSKDLFTTDNPLDSITPDGVIQGAIGDCYFMAALASMAANDPQAIKDMIEDNGDGTYTVTFKGAPDEPITVTKPTDAELARYGKATEHGIWAAVIEKAYGKYCNEHLLSRSPGHLLPGDDDYSGADGGSARAAGIRILTGKGVDDDLMMFTSEKELSKKLQMAMTAGRIVTAGIGKQLNSDNTTSNGLPGGHEYSVIDYDPETKLVTLRNPWGEGEPKDANGDPLDGTDDGVFTMTLADFRKHFTVINYQEA